MGRLPKETLPLQKIESLQQPIITRYRQAQILLQREEESILYANVQQGDSRGGDCWGNIHNRGGNIPQTSTHLLWVESADVYYTYRCTGRSHRSYNRSRCRSYPQLVCAKSQ